MAIRTIFYIDGFNLYHGIKSAGSKLDTSWHKYNWIDLVKFANLFLDNSHELLVVKYFTATPIEPENEKKQTAFLKANILINGNKIQIIKGKYYKKQIKCQSDCKKYFDIHEEKRTDVNIAVEMLGDVACSKVDLVILISADSDLVPPIAYIFKNYEHIRIKIIFPPCRKSYDILNLMNKKVIISDLNKLKFEKSVMPYIVALNNDVAIIPEDWK